MSLLTINHVISRVRQKLKAKNVDAGITDREIYNLLRPYVDQALKELDGKSRIMGFSSIFQTLDYVPLVEIDSIEASKLGIRTGITVSRTKEPILIFMEGYSGPLIRSITSIDGSESLSPITASQWQLISKAKNFKYNKTKYYWYVNDLLYFPNIDWPGVKIEAVTWGDISKYKNDPDEKCLRRQDQSFNIPDFLVSRIEELALHSLAPTLQIPTDINKDNQSILK